MSDQLIVRPAARQSARLLIGLLALALFGCEKQEDAYARERSIYEPVYRAWSKVHPQCVLTYDEWRQLQFNGLLPRERGEMPQPEAPR